MVHKKVNLPEKYVKLANFHFPGEKNGRKSMSVQLVCIGFFGREKAAFCQ